MKCDDESCLTTTLRSHLEVSNGPPSPLLVGWIQQGAADTWQHLSCTFLLYWTEPTPPAPNLLRSSSGEPALTVITGCSLVLTGSVSHWFCFSHLQDCCAEQHLKLGPHAAPCLRSRACGAVGRRCVQGDGAAPTPSLSAARWHDVLCHMLRGRRSAWDGATYYLYYYVIYYCYLTSSQSSSNSGLIIGAVDPEEGTSRSCAKCPERISGRRSATDNRDTGTGCVGSYRPSVGLVTTHTRDRPSPAD